jgi:hypothetical protein
MASLLIHGLALSSCVIRAQRVSGVVIGSRPIRLFGSPDLIGV